MDPAFLPRTTINTIAQVARASLDNSTFTQAMVLKMKAAPVEVTAPQPATTQPGPVEQTKMADLIASARPKGALAELIRNQEGLQVQQELLRAKNAQAKADALGAVAGMHKAAAEIAKSGIKFP